MSGYKGLQQYMHVEGKTYFLPLDLRPFLVYYNRTLFDQQGVAYPAPGWTWESFRSIAMKLDNHQAAKAVKLHPNILRLMLLQSTDDILTISRTAITKAVSLLAGMLNDQSVAIEYGPLNSLMKVDQIVKVNYSNPVISFAPLPMFSETDRYTPTEIWGFAVPASSKHPEAAWKVAAHLTGLEGAAFFSTFGYIAGYRSSEVEKSLLTRMDPGLDRMMTTIRSSMLATPPTVEGRTFQNTFITMQRNLAQGTVTVEEALTAILDSHSKL